MDKQTQAILFLMNEAKRNALGEDFAVLTGTTQRTYLIRTIMSLNIEGAKFDFSRNDYIIEPHSPASQILRSCGFFTWGDDIPAKVQPAKNFIGSV